MFSTTDDARRSLASIGRPASSLPNDVHVVAAHERGSLRHSVKTKKKVRANKLQAAGRRNSLIAWKTPTRSFLKIAPPTKGMTLNDHPGQDPMNVVLSLMGDEGFTSQHMPFLLDDDHVVLGSFTEATYALRAEINVKELLDDGLTAALNLVPGFGAATGYAFVASITSVIPLPPGYTASRFVQSSSDLIFALSGSFPVKVAFGESESRAGASLLVFGVLSHDGIDQMAAFDKALSYANDVLTSYRLVRHDHGIQPLLARQMPGAFDCYTMSFAEELFINGPEQLSIHANDKMDVWAKRSLIPSEYQEFLSHLEGLINSSEVRYLLNLAVSSIDDLCLGQFESAVLNSDRFMELALRLCYLKHPELPNEKLGSIVSVYSPRPRSSTLLGHLTPKLEIKATDFIEAWAANSRRLRNAVAHKLDFSVVTPQSAHLAVEYNLALVSLLAHKFPAADRDVRLLGDMVHVLERLFGRQRPAEGP